MSDQELEGMIGDVRSQLAEHPNPNPFDGMNDRQVSESFTSLLPKIPAPYAHA